jgi:rubrerythrin
MQGVQKVKCTSCGTMFMSEAGVNTCPSCSESNHTHIEHKSGSTISGCGCGHSH